jgi:hypothetical protein
MFLVCKTLHRKLKIELTGTQQKPAVNSGNHAAPALLVAYLHHYVIPEFVVPFMISLMEGCYQQ